MVDAIGEGSFATVVAMPVSKLRRGKRLENWELDYYRTHRAVVETAGAWRAPRNRRRKGGCWRCWEDKADVQGMCAVR